MRVLIVDDDEISVEILANALEQCGHEVLRASNGAEALDLLRTGACRLVISDWEMPGMSGIDLCRRIRAEEFAGYVYVILLTGRDASQDVIEGLSAGADDFVRKPFNAAELRLRVSTGQRILSLETREVTIFAMAKLAESRDPETGAHLERVRAYSRILVREMRTDPAFADQLDDEFDRLLYLTSPLHDIGKVGIPDCVLLKPGRLSDQEFAIMKSHTTIGAATLDAALEQFPNVAFLKMARDVALTHHEWFDGRGYPSGLVGRDIPLAGRIVALADVYDALTSRRVYKKAFTFDVARNILIEERATHLDPGVVDAFLRAEARFMATAQAYAEPG